MNQSDLFHEAIEITAEEFDKGFIRVNSPLIEQQMSRSFPFLSATVDSSELKEEVFIALDTLSQEMLNADWMTVKR